MDKVQNNESLFSVEELEQRLEMTSIQMDIETVSADMNAGPIEWDEKGLHWYF